MSPAFNPGVGKSLTVSGLFSLNAIVPVSLIRAEIFSTVVSPGIGTVSKPIPQTLLYVNKERISYCFSIVPCANC